MTGPNQQDQSKSSEMSMDEVLASIRKIIATDNESAENNTVEDYENSEIIELTNEIKAFSPTDESHMRSSTINLDTSLDHSISLENTNEDFLTHEAIKNSKESINALSKTLASTKNKTLENQKNTTIEDLVVQALKPMLKEWMSNNLPQIVEKIVRQEIQKLTQK
ncbi:MAG: hypothetical protein CMM87_04715 [Rickettsiales bacterium]|nr:hypothetical protein [Rickettsiales bacterium]|tara:strand:+ start:5677 stop:6171 length:495 start_codon:yes stop_codon:yes gene_type:complete